MRAMAKIYGAQAHSNGVQVISSRMMEGFGWNNGLGRILVTMIGKSLSKVSGGCKATFITPLTSEHTI